MSDGSMIGFWVAAFIVVIAGTSALLWMYITRYQDGYVNGYLDCLESLGELEAPKKRTTQLRDRYTTSSGKQFFLENNSREKYLDKRSGFLEEDM